jgi:uncharacterized protein with FMN-binding domain
VKRIVLWVLSTLSALVVLLGYHTSTSSTMATTSEGAISGSLQGQAVAGTTSGSSGSGSPPADSSAGGSGSGSSGSGAKASGGTSSTSSVTGTAAPTRYGPVQVQLEVSGSSITNVKVLQYPDSGHDLQISQYALPQLIQQTLDSKGHSVSMVSGATYTSQGYLQSLQSALDRAGL